jgi:hypothetical protein
MVVAVVILDDYLLRDTNQMPHCRVQMSMSTD